MQPERCGCVAGCSRSPSSVCAPRGVSSRVWAVTFVRNSPSMLPEHAEAGGEVPGLFAVGMAAMLLVPLLLALCIAWFCSRDAYRGGLHRNRSRISAAGDLTEPGDSEGEEDALRPSRRDSWDVSPSRSQYQRSSTKFTPVYFRQANDWCSCTRRPLTSKVALDSIHSLPELHDALRRAREQIYAEQYHGARESAAERGSAGEWIIEYRNAHAKLVRVTKETDLRELSVVKALYVTTKAPPSTTGPSASSSGAIAGSANADRPNDDDDDDASLVSSEAASSVLIDLSLAGCCGVQSTSGGLVINGQAPDAELSASRGEKHRSKQKRSYRSGQGVRYR